MIRKIDVTTGIITRIAGTGVAGNHSHGRAAPGPNWTPPRGWRSTPQVTCSSPTRSTTGWSRSCPTVISWCSRAPARPGTEGDGGRADSRRADGADRGRGRSAGNVYIADAGNNVVRRVDARTGIITTVAGNVAADQANGGLGWLQRGRRSGDPGAVERPRGGGAGLGR